jgi:FkbM family methyltransferase
MIFYSQANQDRWVYEVLSHKTNGFYVDIGAYDGIQTSNTYIFEKYLDWKGICIEPNATAYQNLITNRNSKNIMCALSDYDGFCNFLGDKIIDKNNANTPCFTLETILTENSAPKQIDYISIDVEGHEYDILKNFDFGKWNIKLMTIEHNLYIEGSIYKDKIYELMTQNNFIRIVEDVVCLDSNPAYFNKIYEDWYISSEFYNSLTEEVKLKISKQSKDKTLY